MTKQIFAILYLYFNILYGLCILFYLGQNPCQQMPLEVWVWRDFFLTRPRARNLIIHISCLYSTGREYMGSIFFTQLCASYVVVQFYSQCIFMSIRLGTFFWSAQLNTWEFKLVKVGSNLTLLKHAYSLALEHFVCA